MLRLATAQTYGVVLLPPPELSRELMRLRRAHPVLRSRSVPHVTVKSPFLCRHTPALVLERLAELLDPVAPFELELDGLGAFGQEVIYARVAPSPALADLHRRVVEGLDGMVETLTERYEGAGYVPHLTLVEKLRPDDFPLAWKALAGFRARGRFRVDRLHLLRGAEVMRGVALGGSPLVGT